jgi:hypothetical protein
MLEELAVNVTVWVVETGEATAEKLALVAPAATVTEDGTVTADILLDRLTVWPPVDAAALSVTEQLSLPAPVSEDDAQVSAFNSGCPVPVAL